MSAFLLLKQLNQSEKRNDASHLFFQNINYLFWILRGIRFELFDREVFHSQQLYLQNR